MPKGSDHSSTEIRKVLYIGDPGTRKTSSLLSLLKAGKKLKIWNYDSALAPLISLAKQDCPELLDNIEFENLRDTFKTTAAGPVIDGMPKAFIAGTKLVDKWSDGSLPKDWGADTVMVIDSGTTLARAAFWWAKGLQGAHTFAEGVPLKGVDQRNFYHVAQQAILNFITYITDENFHTNVVYVAHINWLENDGVMKGFPRAIGSAICDEIPAFFPSIIQATKKGNSSPQYIIRCASTSSIDLKDPYSFAKFPELPSETGLATFFGLPEQSMR